MIIDGYSIWMILLGAFIATVGILTGQHFYGKRMSVAKETRVEIDTRRDYPKPGMPPVDSAQFDQMIEEINFADDLQTYANRLKETLKKNGR